MRIIKMYLKSPRINVTFDESIAGLLSTLAQQEHKSLAGIIRDLTLEALELREDLYLSKVAHKLDQDNVKTYSHEEAWK
jgi:hypothetical protein